MARNISPEERARRAKSVSHARKFIDRDVQVAAARQVGLANAASGQLADITTPESCSLGGKIQAEKNLQSGRWDEIRMMVDRSRCGRSTCHKRWHVAGSFTSRGVWVDPKPSPRCEFCVEENLIIAFA